MSSKVRRFRITGLDMGVPIEPYIVETDYRGDIDHHLNCSGDCVRYYEELKWYEEDDFDELLVDVMLDMMDEEDEELTEGEKK